MSSGPPKSDRDKVAALWPHSIRYGREIGVMMLIYIIALAYAATSPIILPFALIYFIFSWIMWRYNILYVSERCFESGGQIWDTVFKQVCCCMFIFEFFTGEVSFLFLLTRVCLLTHVHLLMQVHSVYLVVCSCPCAWLSMKVFVYAALFMFMPLHVRA